MKNTPSEERSREATSCSGKKNRGKGVPRILVSVRGAQRDPILQFFEYGHLPANLQIVSGLFKPVAHALHDTLPCGAEKTMMLRKLLEAKDCAIRAELQKVKGD